MSPNSLRGFWWSLQSLVWMEIRSFILFISSDNPIKTYVILASSPSLFIVVPFRVAIHHYLHQSAVQILKFLKENTRLTKKNSFDKRGYSEGSSGRFNC